MREELFMEKESKFLTTRQLIAQIRRSEGIDTFFSENEQSFIKSQLPEYLYSLMKEKNMTPALLVQMTQFDRSYIYHILAGKRIPSRNTALCIAIALGLTLDETQLLLRLSNRGLLYPKIKYDAAVIYCLSKQMTLMETNALLEELGFLSLSV